MEATTNAAEVARIKQLAAKAAKDTRQAYIVFWDQKTKAVDAVPDTAENRRSIPSRDVIHQVPYV